MFRKILVPVDFTDKNIPAIQSALEIASRNRAQMTLLHVIEKVDYLAPAELKSFYESLEANAQMKMQTLAKQFRKRNVSMDEEIIYGKRAAEIVKYAAKGKFHLIVVSSHRIRPDLPQQDWGTLSYQIAVLSQCPVLLVK